ncbi:rho guanine nucleotide exchange factor 15 isoform X1 [Lepisosteus oculatus]|uniref:rho guanine nucleotide exchange factor 15 isoform X1 n=1 Tax=Lepisosteus oculatus TaxID=7918 RepID=UPI0037122294
MSLPGTAPLPDLKPRFGLPSKPRAKPPVPQKPAPPNGTDCPLAERASEEGGAGKVKRIVSQLCQEEGEKPKREPKRAPTIKPKPPRASRAGKPAVTTAAVAAPPLPLKKSKTLERKEEGGRGGENGAVVPGCQDRGRSDPDGREITIHPSSGEEEEGLCSSAAPPSLSCENNCGCLCHQKWPGMKLVWVPIEEEGGEEEEEEGESETEKGDQGESKIREKQMKDDVDGNTVPLGGPAIPKQESLEMEEESLYETQLMTSADPSAQQEPAVKEPIAKTIPSIVLTKPPRKSKQRASLQPPSSSIEQEDQAPAIPPRVPLIQAGSGRPVSMPTGGRFCGLPISLLPEDCRPLRPLPPADRSLPPSPMVARNSNQQSPNSSGLNSLSSELSQDGDDDDDIGHDWEKVDPVFKEDDSSEWKRLFFCTAVIALSCVRPAGTPPRRMSIDWESRLQDEPLYQTYRASVISKEIKRQTVSRNISKTSQDFTADRLSTLEGRGQHGQSLLWQELPAVKECGILAKLSPAQCKYQESMFEVLTSEASYLRSLKVLIEHFMESRDLDGTLIIREKKILFSNILKIREVSERFLKDLEERVEEYLIIGDICDIIHFHAQHSFPAYIDYVRNQIYQEKTYSHLMQKNVQFAAVIARLQESPQCQRLPFMSFLLLPFQRITRIKMLIENILKRTAEGTKQETNASKALASVSKIIEECNNEVGKMKQMEELIHIHQSLEFDKLKALPIISQNRFLEKRGDLQEMSRGGTLFSLRPKFTPIHLFLFNDLFLITKRSSDRYVVIDHAHRSLVQVQPIDEMSSAQGIDNCFCLTLLENHRGKMFERILKAPTQPDMERWMAAFPNPNNSENTEDETVYEDWDCPQMQCVKQYVAQQADELDLEPTEIINIVRKTNEGWYQGIRLADGQKGWFPAGVVVEITNEHVLRRNLRERYRVIKAAEQFSKSKTAS